MIVGIDLGTTNSLIGVIEKGRPRLFKDGNDATLIPSVLYFDKTERYVGYQAETKRRESPQNSLYSTKRFLGRGKQDVTHWMKLLPFDFSPSDDQMVRFQVAGKPVNPIEAGSYILNHLKNIAEKALGTEVRRAVITVPAYFNDAQRQATKFAGQLAGLEVVRILNEPTAACLAYGLDKKAKGNIAVFDLGGGTFDVSILRVSDGVFEVLATNGDTALGGDDFDHAIAEQLALKLSSPMHDPISRAHFIQKCRDLKHALTESEVASFQWEKTSLQVTRAQLNEWIAPVLERTVVPCLQCLEDAKIAKQEIHDVILVGGSTRMPYVREQVQKLFGREPICTINPDEVVALGAAVQANVLAGQSGEILLLDVLPLSLGIETMGGVVSKLLHRNSTIPIAATETYSTYIDGQVSVDIHILQGERELAKDNRSLARFQLKGIPPLPAGIPKIEIEFTVDANGILSARAIELRTGTMASIVVNPSYGLNDAEVERMLMESFDNAEADFENRFLIEARVEAESLIRATRKSCETRHDLMEPAEKIAIDRAVATLEKSLSSTNHKDIKKEIENLNEATKPLAEKILNQTVREALKDKNVGDLQ